MLSFVTKISCLKKVLTKTIFLLSSNERLLAIAMKLLNTTFNSPQCVVIIVL